jgi:hypothetical protein
MFPPNVTAIGQSRLDDLHRQAERDALIRAARRTRRAQRSQPGHRAPRLLAVVASWARRPRPASGTS